MKNKNVGKSQYNYSNYINNSTIINIIILIILIIVLLLSNSLIKNLFKNETTVLDDVKLREESSNNGFALMLEQEDGTYKESTSSSWPTDMSFNSELSGCIDINGNKIENALSFDSTNNLVNVSVGETAYCYLYFDVASIEGLCIGNEFSNCLIDNETLVGDLWKSTLEDDGYRYVGTDPNNYICFGTSDKDTCINDTDKYMYRIIGIFDDSDGNKHVKLIKKEALNTAYAWDADYDEDADWNQINLYRGINGSFFLTNTSYPYMQDTTWTNKIATWDYTMTNTKTWESINSTGIDGLNYSDNTNKVIYLHELNRSSKSSKTCDYTNGASSLDSYCIGEWKILSTKISLMYASDYALSLGEVALNYVERNNYGTMKTGWMYISNNDSGTPSSYEWTMSRAGGDDDGYYYAWTVLPEGFVDADTFDSSCAVRPVFYLASDVEISGGTGTITDPFLLD